MGHTLIIECPRCGGLLLAIDGQKTRTCPYCGKRVDIIKAKHVASGKNAFEASQILRKMKQMKGFSRE
jgi:uncharacterized Zn finger protein (UPF0148 family)